MCLFMYGWLTSLKLQFYAMQAFYKLSHTSHILNFFVGTLTQQAVNLEHKTHVPQSRSIYYFNIKNIELSYGWNHYTSKIHILRLILLFIGMILGTENFVRPLDHEVGSGPLSKTPERVLLSCEVTMRRHHLHP